MRLLALLTLLASTLSSPLFAAAVPAALSLSSRVAESDLGGAGTRLTGPARRRTTAPGVSAGGPGRGTEHRLSL